MYHLGDWQLVNIADVTVRTRRTYLRAEEDTDQQRQGGNKSRAELQSPGNCTCILDSEVGNRAQEDTESSPQLPTTISRVDIDLDCARSLPGHHKSSTDSSGRVLGGEDGHSRTLAAHTDTKKQTCHEELFPS